MLNKIKKSINLQRNRSTLIWRGGEELQDCLWLLDEMLMLILTISFRLGVKIQIGT